MEDGENGQVSKLVQWHVEPVHRLDGAIVTHHIHHMVDKIVLERAMRNTTAFSRLVPGLLQVLSIFYFWVPITIYFCQKYE